MVFVSNEYIYLTLLIITLLATEDNDITYGIQSLILVDWKVYDGSPNCT